MKSLMLLAREILADAGIWCHVSTTHDYNTVVSRVKHEGLSFLTITLPSFCDDLQKGLSQGYVSPSMFPSFRKRRSLPIFLGGFLDLVFDRETGRLLDDPNVDAIVAVRQVTLAFGKIKVDCTQQRVDRALAKYIECEKEVKHHDLSFALRRARFMRVSVLLFGGLLSRVDHEVYNRKIVPRHGPGATADRLVGNDKWNQTEWPLRLEREFPVAENVFSSYSEFLSNESGITFLEPGTERPVKVITVPKTLKTPRIIAVEPTAMQYMQQGLLRCLVDAIEEDDFSFNFIRFIDQTENQKLAKLGSLNSSLATLDLSEASDRVSNQHVRALLKNHGSLARAVDSCRSRKADVPGYGVQRLAKFASMGSALCFPFEAMVFCTVVFMGIEAELNRPLTRKDIKSFFGRVRVYGDDIIVPTEYVISVIDSLESFGFKVNRSKSFWTGKFRESCGKEYYDGHDVSITRVRTLLPAHRRNAQEIVSTVSTRNRLYEQGYWRTARYLDSIITRVIPFPNGLSTSPALVRTSSLGYCAEKEDPRLHRPLVRAAVAVPKKRVSPLDGYGALTKCLLPNRFLPFSEDHLEFAGRPTAVDIKQRWSQPY